MALQKLICTSCYGHLLSLKVSEGSSKVQSISLTFTSHCFLFLMCGNTQQLWAKRISQADDQFFHRIPSYGFDVVHMEREEHENFKGCRMINFVLKRNITSLLVFLAQGTFLFSLSSCVDYLQELYIPVDRSIIFLFKINFVTQLHKRPKKLNNQTTPTSVVWIGLLLSIY